MLSTPAPWGLPSGRPRRPELGRGAGDPEEKPKTEAAVPKKAQERFGQCGILSELQHLRVLQSTRLDSSQTELLGVGGLGERNLRGSYVVRPGAPISPPEGGASE